MSDDPRRVTVAATSSCRTAQTSAAVPVTAVAQIADVTLTAMLGTQTQTAHVRVLGADRGAVDGHAVADRRDGRAGGTAQFTVTLDIPARVGQVGLAVTPPSAGTLPASVTIAGEQCRRRSRTPTPASGTATSPRRSARARDARTSRYRPVRATS